MRSLFQRVGCTPRLLWSQPSRCGRNGQGDCSSRCPPSLSSSCPPFLLLLLLPRPAPPPPPCTWCLLPQDVVYRYLSLRRRSKDWGACLTTHPLSTVSGMRNSRGIAKYVTVVNPTDPLTGEWGVSARGGDTDDLGIMMIVTRVGTREMAGAHCVRQRGVAINVDRFGMLLRDL